MTLKMVARGKQSCRNSTSCKMGSMIWRTASLQNPDSE